MDYSAIRHRNSYCECYALDSETVVLLLQTGKDAKQAFVICEDPFINDLQRKPEWTGQRVEMTERLELTHHVLWRVCLKPAYKRLQYYFEITSEEETVLLFEDRVCDAKDKDNRSLQYFKFPWLNPADVIAPPESVKNTVWYQIMPDRFCKAQGTNTDPRFRAWGNTDNPRFNDSYGGNLRGITERLDYLRDLGVNGIYLNPVFESDSYHKYNTFDYTRIDPDLGTNDDMKQLVTEAHARGMKVMLDGVFNHCGVNFFAWKDVCEKGTASPYYRWFFVNQEDFQKGFSNTSDGRFYSFSFWPGMPKLNTNNQEVIAYFTDICLGWVRDWDIDGIRFDVGDEVSHRFIACLNRALKAAKPEFFMLGEIWFDSIEWLGGTQYDSVMNYPLSNCLNDFFTHQDMTARELMCSINACLTMYPQQTAQVLFNFLDTHDTVRAFEGCGNSTDKLLQRIALLLTLPGSPCLYYGTEIALKGVNQRDNRHCMPWDKIECGKFLPFYSRVQELIALRKSHPLCTEFSTEVLPQNDHPRLLHIIKTDGSKRLNILLNAGDSALPLSHFGQPLFSNGLEGDTLLPDGTVIYETTL